MVMIKVRSFTTCALSSSILSDPRIRKVKEFKYKVKVKVKVKCTLEQAVKVQMVSRSIAYSFFNLGAR